MGLMKPQAKEHQGHLCELEDVRKDPMRLASFDSQQPEYLCVPGVHGVPTFLALSARLRLSPFANEETSLGGVLFLYNCKAHFCCLKPPSL
jgi:hypothetical protein